jgi:hypothetical protein
MVRRSIIRLSVIIFAIGSTLPLSAGEIGEFLSSVARDAKRRNCWPEPFVYADRETYRQTMAIQNSAGWERQNLLSEFHFLPGGGELNEAGRMRVQWILSESPETRRQIYVHRANSPQETSARMQSVQRLVDQSAYVNNVPIIESTRTDEGWPADRVDLVSRKSATSALDPKLLGSSNAGTGAGGH